MHGPGVEIDIAMIDFPPRDTMHVIAIHPGQPGVLLVTAANEQNISISRYLGGCVPRDPLQVVRALRRIILSFGVFLFLITGFIDLACGSIELAR